jgi:co-chaperonin GroES (HSP10)
MDIQPLFKKILIAENKVEKKTASGIILEGATSIRETKFATVLAVGEDVTKVKVGDKIVLDWSKCFPVKTDAVERALIDEEHVLAVGK